ncbi:MAG: hypothetical protein ACREO4_06115 [Lysobacter sp.]
MPISFTLLSTTHTDGTGDGELFLEVGGIGPAITMLTGVGDGGFVLTGEGLMEQFSGDVAPAVPSTGDGQLYLGAGGVGYVRVFGEGDARLTLAGDGFGGGSATVNGYGDGGVALGGYGLEAAPLTAYGFLLDRPPAMEGYGGMVWDRLEERLSLDRAATGHATAVLTAAMGLSGNPASAAELATLSSEVMSFETALSVVYYLLVEEGVTFSDLPATDHLAIVRVVERLLIDGHAGNLADAASMVVSGLVFGELTEALALATATDALTTTAGVAEQFLAMEALVEAAIFDAGVIDTHTAMVLVEEELLAGADLSSAAEMTTLVRESVGFALTLSLDSGEYIAWVLNTESRGLSRYTQYPFNSFAKIGGRYYGAVGSGIHRLDGDDDAGEPIAARLRMGLSDLGTRVLKRVPEAYVGYSSDGTLLLRVISIEEVTGAKQAATYKLAPRGAAATRENRFKMGRGVKSVDWDFEIENVDGADFTLDSIEFRPLRLDRRTRG